ncbi:DNA-directed DNA polymerase [Alteripontixanthobacter maritimus]|uniref:DNA polymerase III subunit gamma/tau n=1 Tax=Alteripontixanthobacter maritimus TaxID=2161824 RepID=A0A369Q9X6_9SPHN|nr:DNA polymerase III subunit gamma/tau [Alteripontixanthobacter maritimus]RDC60355.1 DNA-directed DNA polymerase [Alteripontixanthobacter maritimus]
MGESETPELDENTPSAAELEAAGQAAMFGAPPKESSEPGKPAADAPVPEPASAAKAEPPVKSATAPATDPSQPYRVLARKYRPQTFSELIGQEPMVRTLGNAIARDRLAHAFLMTGVRGVGKTSTARLIAKALNCIGPDGQGGPTIQSCGVCEPCVAIAEGRHIDVIEMDAASHTGVDDVREIIEAVRYAAVSARYKIYIIDEVHMLSRNAFNALLKTLEEPPAHVKFLFATTEVEKLPVTVLSRTQRFDLRRIPADMLADHFGSICRQEGVEAGDEALRMIAAAAEGSVRDGLSILDQAIAHADLENEAKVTADRVRDMLGLADKGAQRRLLAALLEGDATALLDAIADQYALGVEPLALMRGLMDLCHRITVTKLGGEGAAAALGAASEDERQALESWANALLPGQLHRLWQLLLKGHGEVRQAPDPLVAAQMALLRALHAADMPDPGSLVKTLEEMAASAAANPAAGASSTDAGTSAAQSAAAGPDFPELVSRIERSGKTGALLLATKMKMQVEVISLEPGHLVYRLADGFTDDLGPDLRQALLDVTGTRWQVELGSGDAEAAPTMVAADRAAHDARRAETRRHPLVEATFAAFPDAEIVETDENAPTSYTRSA